MKKSVMFEKEGRKKVAVELLLIWEMWTIGLSSYC
jgi:hypothetical protein